MDSSKKYDNPSPEITANQLSKLLYCWLVPFFRYGLKNNLQPKDLYNTTKPDLSEPLGDTLEKEWISEVNRAKRDKKQPKLLNAIKKTFIKPYALAGLVVFSQCICLNMLQPIVLAEYINYFSPEKPYTLIEGWFLAIGVILMAFLNSLVMHHVGLFSVRLGMRCRVACCSLVYRKLLKLSKTALGQTAVGQVINLISNDVARFDITPFFLHYIWIMPIQAVAATIIMYRIIGVAAFAGMTAIAIQAVPLQGYLSKLQGKLRYKIAQRTDKRVKLMIEITSGIQVIKMYAWEKPFEKMVEIARKLEIDVITTTSYIRGFSIALMVFTERTTLYLTVITYALLGNTLTGDKVFSIAQLFNTVQLYMAIFYPMAIANYAEAKISVQRLEDFLTQEENTNLSIESNVKPKNKTGLIKVEKVKASWIPNPIIDTISNINLNIGSGTLCAVVGQVGCGKSSLLQLFLKELPFNSGSMELNGIVSYASQEPWLFVSSVRNNILFGLPYDKNRYREVVNVCALEKDFEQLPYGDKTMVGERGVSLSGGQRARINLARAVYRQADIYLFDDPLSAVDAHVGKHLFEECIMKYLKNKTRILVTHQLQFLKQSDLIVILSNGQIQSIGTFNELSENELKYLNQEASPDDEKLPEAIIRKRLLSIVSESSTIVDEEDAEEPTEKQELMEKGAISSSVYKQYFRAGGSILLLLFLVVLLILAQMASNASDIWVKHWTNKEETKLYNKAVVNNITQNNTVELNVTVEEIDLFNITTDNITFPELNTDAEILSRNIYIYIYTNFIIASIVLTTLRSLLFFKICMNASKNLHGSMFNNVLQATMRFFDTNPSGRILNRFSKDMGAIDEMLPRAILEAVQVFLVMSGILIIVFHVTVWMIIPTIVLGILFFLVRKIYIASAQDVKRLEGIARAPIMSHVSASFYGLPTIRSCGAQNIITKEFDLLQDQHTSAWVLFISSSEAFGFFLDAISVVFLAIVTLQFLIFDDGTTMSGDVGLVISQSLILTGMLQYGVRQTAEVASQMTSVERVLQYTKLDKEGPFESLPTTKPHRDWPQRGNVNFNNLSLRYAPEDPPVLKNLNIDIKAGEKIGIVGRTGAGKSSLIAALFRLAPFEGTITIDDVNIAKIGLNDLRTKISIIPQEPVLFSSTLRYNLDPFVKSIDKDLWKVVEDVELKDTIDSLDCEVSQGGSNFSAGQRQLVCLARAIIRNNKILVMDEATANVDPQTDALIQKTIRKNFKDCTVLTIAHRLNTVMDSDKVLVMDSGEAVEFGHPHELLRDTDGYLSKMLQETGKNMENKLKKIAKEAYNTSTL